ncbi:alpha/beta fold hydrolase [Modestobacter sp. VKM Ac-2985]|uniref:alpha/beta fold hydrolase n=1 Tax=Modestobacter sp. VKM Ac-2985 TaxID=3004139 RepID=UPI0022ABBA6F|nr:alpha/beta fold hydrolase [Modestobacter sp. VKM Ac-2985]MCZ2840149.1 alpha/beta fold hydrolase [Modestobacter sp. VKM Ac-2985]
MSIGYTGVLVTRTSDPSGAAGTVVLVNSLATTTAMWDDVVPALAERFDVVRFDQRDRGGPAAREPFSLDDLVDDVVGVLDEVGTERVHLAGISLGGLVALRTAARRPERLLSVTAMCCAARFSREVWVDRCRLVRDEGIAPIVPMVMDRWFTQDFQERRPDVLARYREMLATTDAAGYAHAGDVLADADVRDDLPRITVPTLVVGGEADTANPVTDQELIARAVPGARLAVVRGAAHLAPVAEPAEVARLIAGHATAHPA